MLNQEHSIVAFASAIGGGVAIIRLSGKDSLSIAQKAWYGKKKLNKQNARQALFGYVQNTDGQAIDETLALYMNAPHSFTGEDVVEFHCHGGHVISRQILETLLSLGAKPAEAGEFTKRAFLNGKIDLTQAEAINDMILAKTKKATNRAFAQMQGKLGNTLNALYEKCLEFYSETEVRMDFVDEDLDWSTTQELNDFIITMDEQFTELIKTEKNTSLIQDGIKLVIGGQPNVGKSSLMNYLLGYNRAIVSDIEGTTRDSLEGQIQIGEIPVKLIDTAGIRQTKDKIEQIGVKRSQELIQEADIIFWLIDATKDIQKQLKNSPKNKKNTLLIINKIDLNSKKISLNEDFVFHISIKEELGIQKLLTQVEQILWETDHDIPSDMFINARQSQHLKEAKKYIAEIRRDIKQENWELLAINLRACLQALGDILGKTHQPDILHNIFSKYCIGK